jgi:hypothetical protein
MRVGLALPHRQEATRIARPSDGSKAESDSLENLEEAFERRFSISIPNLSIANTSTSSGSFELIHRNHQKNFGKSEAAERVLRDLEHNRRYRD